MKTKFILLIFVSCWFFFTPLALRAAEVHVIEMEKKTWIIPETINVHVTDENAAPVPGAHVCIHLCRIDSEGKHHHISRETKSDEAGNATLALGPELSGKKYDTCSIRSVGTGVLLNASKSWDAKTNPEEPNVTLPENVEITLPEGKMVRMRVVDENGDGIPDVEVKDSSSSLSPILRTDAEGYYEIGPVVKTYQHSYFNATYRHPDYQVFHRQFSSQTDSQTVQLKRGFSLSGSIKDEQGNPVEGADVYAYGNTSVSRSKAQTDAHGNFKLGSLPPCPILFIAGKKGATSEFVRLVQPEQFEQPLEVSLRKSAKLRIRFETDHPEYARYFTLTRPTMSLDHFDYQPRYFQHDLPLHSSEEDAKRDYTLLECDVAPDEEIEYTFQTRPYGFVKPLLDESPVIFYSEHPSYKLSPREEPYTIRIRSSLKGTTTAPPSSEVPLNVGIPLPPLMSISVLDENAQPKKDASLQLVLEFHSFAGGGSIVKTFPVDAKGKVRLDFTAMKRLNVNSLTLTVKAEGYSGERLKWIDPRFAGVPRSREIPLTAELDFLLSPETKTVGLVRDEQGKPIEGAKVRLTDIDRSTLNDIFYESYDKYDGPPEDLITTTNAAGIWSFDLVSKERDEDDNVLGSDEDDNVLGNCVFAIEKDGYYSKKTSLGAKRYTYEWRRITVLLQPKTIRGTVLDPSGKPLFGVAYRLLHSERPRRNVEDDVTGFHGSFEIELDENLKREKTKLYFTKPGWSPVLMPVDLSQETENLQLTMYPTKEMEFMFIDERGKGIPDVTASVSFPKSEFPLFQQHNLGLVLQFEDVKSDTFGLLKLKDVSVMEMEYTFNFPRHVVNTGESYPFKPNDKIRLIRATNQFWPAERYLKYKRQHQFAPQDACGAVAYWE